MSSSNVVSETFSLYSVGEVDDATPSDRELVNILELDEAAAVWNTGMLAVISLPLVLITGNSIDCRLVVCVGIICTLGLIRIFR